MSFDPSTAPNPGAKIKVIGVGGGGTNAVSTMIRSDIEGVDFICANTDIQSLRFSLAGIKIQLGKQLTKGLGAGADPDIGRDAALEDRHELQEALSGADMVFITAGMGGGTGTGGASVVSQIARDMGALTVGVVTKPFNFEGKRRKRHAEIGIERLREQVDTLIVIPNQRLLQIATPSLSMIDAFKMADNVLVNAVRGISDIINVPGMVNVDFADVKTIMSSMGQALMGIGFAAGENRATDAAKQAICSPLLEDIDIEGATGILLNITAGPGISLMEVNDACSIIQEAAHEEANIIFGTVIDEAMGDHIRVTVIATGFPTESDDSIATESKIRYQSHSTLVRKNKISTQIPSNYSTSQEPKKNSYLNFLHDNKSQEFKPESKVEKKTQQTSTLSINSIVFSEQPQEPASSHPKEVKKHNDVEELALWTIKSINQEPSVEDSIKMESSFGTPDISVLQDRTLQEKTRGSGLHFEEATSSIYKRQTLQPNIDPIPKTMDSESYLLGARFETSSLKKEVSSASKNAIFDDFLFSKENLQDDIDKKIDEALELAERVKKIDQSEDQIDIPTFLRGDLKDLNLP